MKVKSESEVVQSCPTPSDPMDYSLPGSSVHGIFQARVLEWDAIDPSLPSPNTKAHSFKASRGVFQNYNHGSDSYHPCHTMLAKQQVLGSI